MPRLSAYFALLALPATPLSAQAPAAPDTVRSLASLHQTLVGLGPTIGPRIWPGFRPDTIPTLYVVPHRAKLFVQWRDTLPTGFVALDSRTDAAWTDARPVSFPRGRPIAFLAVDSNAAPGAVLGLALHEQFHALEAAAARAGRRFGAGENSLLVATYPTFDVANEASLALEGRLLRRALRAATTGEAERHARAFLATRERRHGRLDSAFSAFETAAELHEGLAQYAQLRGLHELARLDAARFAPVARAEAAGEAALLDSLLVVGPRSVRRRFYATGSAIALLLDRFVGESWKERLVREDATLAGMLAAATGFAGRTGGPDWTPRIAAELSRLRRDAERAAASLGARRAAQRDSILARPGLRLVVDPSRLPGARLNWCGFDPQNVLQTASGELLHTRMLRACAGAGVDIQLEQPVVEERATGVLRAAVGEPDAITLTTAGVVAPLPADGSVLDVRDVRMQGPAFTLLARRATLTRRGGELRVTPTPP